MAVTHSSSPRTQYRHQRLRVAYHEAGHAAVGMHFGSEVSRVRINPDGSGACSWGWRGAQDVGTRSDCIMLLAGRLAEEMVPGVDASVSDEWLRSVIRRLRAGDTEIANDDDAKVLTALGVEALTDEELISDYRALEEETRKLLEDPDISRAIDALARALLREGKGRLEGEPAMALVDNTEDEAALSEGALRRREEEWLLEVVALAACDLEKDGEPPAETDEGDEGW